jgi:hypothetical protein
MLIRDAVKEDFRGITEIYNDVVLWVQIQQIPRPDLRSATDRCGTPLVSRLFRGLNERYIATDSKGPKERCEAG